jgi:predicted nucleic acid-binding Zn ribbon protein
MEAHDTNQYKRRQSGARLLSWLLGALLLILAFLFTNAVITRITQ